MSEAAFPLAEELHPPPDPVEACARFAGAPHCAFLDSAPGFARLGRHSFLCADPFLVLRSKGRVVEQIEAAEEDAGGGGSVQRSIANPFDVVQARLRQYAADTIPGLPPFQGGAAGYFAYDMCHHLERLPAPRYDDLALPELDLGFYDWVLAWDHAARRCWLISTGRPQTHPARRARRAARRARQVKEALASPEPKLKWPPPEGADGPALGTPALDLEPGRSSARGESAAHPVPGIPGVCSSFTSAGYRAIVRRAIEYILDGDIFQANLSQRLAAAWPRHPFELYRRLRQVNPAPFAAYLAFGSAAVVSASPERFLRLTGRQVETRPIKGTRPRGFTPEHDLALDDWLQQSEKDRAENVMIVDLLRNDLSRVCRDGSVQVPELCVIEHFASVHHLVSTVVAELRPGLDAVDLLRATFPGGSVTGAPKIRAMEIIAELEPTRRSAYCGAIGYIGFDGTMDTSIVIRTFIVQPDGRAYFQVGGAVVVDSDPEAEYLETLDKAQGLVAALDDEDHLS